MITRRRGLGDPACAANDQACLANLMANPLVRTVVSSDPLPCCSGTASQIEAAAGAGACDPNCLSTDMSTSGGLSFLSQQLYSLQNLLTGQQPQAGQWIAGIPNTVTAVGGAILAVMLLASMGGRR